MQNMQPTENNSDLFNLENGAVARQRLYSLKSLNFDIKITIVGPTPRYKKFFHAGTNHNNPNVLK